MLFRTVALLLVVLFAAAALHEVVFLVLGQEHNHATCPFCHMIHMPLLLGLCAVLTLNLSFVRNAPLPPRDAPVCRRFALQPDLRAPPLL